MIGRKGWLAVAASVLIISSVAIIAVPDQISAFRRCVLSSPAYLRHTATISQIDYSTDHLRNVFSQLAERRNMYFGELQAASINESTTRPVFNLCSHRAI